MNAHTAISPIAAQHRAAADASLLRAFLALDPAYVVGWSASSPGHSARLADCLQALTDAMAGFDPDNGALGRMADAADCYAADKAYALEMAT